MLIANPIYDVVFKYLLEDNKIAKLFLGAIIGAQIDKLDFRPQEYSAVLEKKKSKKLKNLSPNLTVYRLDFSAKIRNTNGFPATGRIPSAIPVLIKNESTKSSPLPAEFETESPIVKFTPNGVPGPVNATKLLIASEPTVPNGVEGSAASE